MIDIYEGFFDPINDVNHKSALSVLYGYINKGQSAILQLTSKTDATDMSKARYIALCGVNKTERSIKIIDPLLDSEQQIRWVSLDTLINGGYDDNDDLVFKGEVIEYSDED